MHKLTSTLLTLFLLLAFPVVAQIKITNGAGATLDDLIRDKSLTTIVLKGNARDTNLIITGINKNTLTFQTAEGGFSAYPITMIQEIRVQEDRVAGQKSVFAMGSLSNEEKFIVDRAAARAFEVFKQSQNDQHTRMAAASLMAVMGSDDALMYLKGLAEGNDTPTAVSASLHLYDIGEKIDSHIIHDGFLNGNRMTRTQSAILVGLSGDTTFLKELRTMLSDPSEDVYPYAARSLAMLNDRHSLPRFYKGIESLGQPKSEAAIYALIKMGDDEVMGELKKMLPNANQSEWLRIIRVLYALGDKDAAISMRKKGLNTIAHEEAAGILLGENEDWDGVLWIREYLERKRDPDFKNLVFNAHLGNALYDSAQAQAKIVFQQLMRMTETQIYAKGFNNDIGYKKETIVLIQVEACRLLGLLGDKSMLSILTRPMEHPDPRLSLAACEAAINIAVPSYRNRSIATSEYLGYRENLLTNIFK